MVTTRPEASTMSLPETPKPKPKLSLASVQSWRTAEEKLHLLQEELIKLNAQLEYLRLMLKLRR
ncbi:MAG: hypothetical protein IT390_08795 [Nitrospira sp.]|nr:hypothetical protein [Nitrospira sp.]